MRRGALACRIKRSRRKAPNASPAKNPVTAPRTAIISVPSARLNTRVHTISYPSPAKPEAATIGISFQPGLLRRRSRVGNDVLAQAAVANVSSGAIVRLSGSDAMIEPLCLYFLRSLRWYDDSRQAMA